MIQGLLVLNYDGYSMERWHGTLLFYAIILLSLFINTYLARLLPKIEGMVLIIHVVGFVCILIPLVYLAPHGTATDVFATFTNGGGWNTDGLAFFVGLSTSMFSFIGQILKIIYSPQRLTRPRGRRRDSHGYVYFADSTLSQQQL